MKVSSRGKGESPILMNNVITDPGHPSIEIKGLNKSFGNHQALKDVDLSIVNGERLVIFGPNGAGKTTLIKVLATLIKPSAGNIRINGMDIRRNQVEARRCVGIVSHQTFLYNDLTLYENLRFYGKMYDVQDLEKQINTIADRVQLTPRLHDRVGTLSRGLQQRASIARAILHDPSIILLDEPEVGLDSKAIELTNSILDIYYSQGRTVVITTHNLERGIGLGDKAVILSKGKIVYQAPISEVDIDNFQKTYDQYTETGE